MRALKARRAFAKLTKGWNDLALHDAIWCAPANRRDRPGLTLRQRAVLAKLVVYAGVDEETGRHVAWPSARTVAEVGLNKDTAAAVLRELETLGLVAVTRVPGMTPVFDLEDLPKALAALLVSGPEGQSVSESRGRPVSEGGGHQSGADCPKAGDSPEGVSETRGVPSEPPRCPSGAVEVSPPRGSDTLLEGTLEGTEKELVCASDDAPNNGDPWGLSPDGNADAPIAKKAARSRKRPARSRPDDWQPNDTHRAFAAEHRLDLEHEASQFIDHHDAKGSVFADWDAAFRTWLRNAVKFQSERNGKSNGRKRWAQSGGDNGQTERSIAAGREFTGDA